MQELTLSGFVHMVLLYFVFIYLCNISLFASDCVVCAVTRMSVSKSATICSHGFMLVGEDAKNK